MLRVDDKCGCLIIITGSRIGQAGHKAVLLDSNPVAKSTGLRHFLYIREVNISVILFFLVYRLVKPVPIPVPIPVPTTAFREFILTARARAHARGLTLALTVID